ncbi:hypothetical protein CAMGR0001_0725 [Campylobacter gracilis RM3268]|uniref:Uncharacterized protein n=1 Tax=Campylobacter gracilis RM3268 TaxID=553220 RepID=C8PFT2_9BACT|nr:hypothetical protein CAMGR0001_0725 [Campylobacter gracilis RM3268]
MLLALPQPRSAAWHFSARRLAAEKLFYTRNFTLVRLNLTALRARKIYNLSSYLS